MKSIFLAAVLLAASNSDSCGTEAPDARENPNTDQSYSTSSPAAEYESTRAAQSERGEGGE